MSRWKTTFENQKVLEKIQGTLRVLQSTNLEKGSPSDKTEYVRAVKVLKLLEVRFTTLDPELFNQNTWGNFSSWFNDIQGYANSAAQNPTYFQHINNRLDEVLNVLRPIDLQFSEKEVKALAEAGAVYQQKLVGELDQVKKHAEEIKKQYDSLSKEITQGKAKLDQNDQVIQQQKARLDQSIVEFQKQFSTSQEKRGQDFVAEIKKHADKFTDQTNEFEKSFKEASTARKSEFDAVLANTKKQNEAHLDFLKTKEEEVKKIFGAIGTSALAGNFGNTATQEGHTANVLRWIALALMAAMIAVGGYAFYYSIGHETDWRVFLFRLGTVLVLAIPAVYAANESSKHRDRERHNRKIHLELAAIDAYLVLLPEAKRNEIKGNLTEKFFGVPEVLEKTETVSKKDLFSLIKMVVSDLTKGK